MKINRKIPAYTETEEIKFDKNECAKTIDAIAGGWIGDWNYIDGRPDEMYPLHLALMIGSAAVNKLTDEEFEELYNDYALNDL